MKIRRNTDDTLIAEDRPWLLAIMFSLFILIFTGIGLFMLADGIWAGLVFLGFGGLVAPAFFAIFVRRVQLVLHRPENWAEIRRKSVFRQSVTRYALSEIRGATLDSTSGDSGTLYRVALIVAKGGITGPVPLTQAYSNLGDHRGVADAINAWLGPDATV